MQYLLLLGLFLTEDLYDGGVPNPKITVAIPLCTDSPRVDLMVFKAENNKRRFIIRTVHCSKI